MATAVCLRCGELKFPESRFRRVFYFAREEAIRLQHDYIGPEHLLLGIVREGDGIAAKVLGKLDLDFEQIQQAVESMVKSSGGTLTIGEIPFALETKRVLQVAIEEARLLGHKYLGPEHLLLGLSREGEGVAAQVLAEFDVDRQRVGEEVLKLLRASVTMKARETKKERKKNNPVLIGEPDQQDCGRQGWTQRIQTISKCPNCGFEPDTPESRGQHILATDHYHSAEELAQISAQVKAGESLSFDAAALDGATRVAAALMPAPRGAARHWLLTWALMVIGVVAILLLLK